MARERAVVWTLDAIIMAMVLFAGLGVIFYALPSPGDITEDNFDETQLQSDADDLISIANENGQLTEAVLYWDDTSGEFVDSGGEYVTLPSDHPLHDVIEPLELRGIGISLMVEYKTESGVTEQKTIMHQGTPGERSVSTSQTVLLHNDDELVGPDSGTAVEDANTYFAPDANPDSNIYNTMTVYMVIWRT